LADGANVGFLMISSLDVSAAPPGRLLDTEERLRDLNGYY
jgi:hypothetical protein